MAKNSDLFHVGQSRRTSAALNVTMKNGAKLAKKIAKLAEGGETALKNTVSDYANRAPGWVKKGVRQHYGVDTEAIDKAGPKVQRGNGRTFTVGGTTVDGVSLEYKGKTLTTTHFNQSPSSVQSARQTKYQRIPGQAIRGAGAVAMIRQPRKYTVKATILKGHRASMKAGTFIATAKNATLPFQKTSASRYPVHPVRTLSVPQMISGKAKETIDSLIDENMEKRLEHHIERVMK